jgi:hypothetical protein
VDSQGARATSSSVSEWIAATALVKRNQPLYVMFCGANALDQAERVSLGWLNDRFRCFGWCRH